ncbi:MAG: hypothetical protein IJT12_03290 [Paludibacteraceae bacterium]|nr:hypothetical protein [Paludibacteraceae bacterium]
MNKISTMTLLISKTVLRHRLSTAIDKRIAPEEFAWFFGCFCARYVHYSARYELRDIRIMRNAKGLTYHEVQAFSDYCGYDLRFPIPLPL